LRLEPFLEPEFENDQRPEAMGVVMALPAVLLD
jgi:hypothetical protein